ncbi:sensor histidine kinase [Actinoplanes sp. L3-i22]|uniref:sensor histidine kinase n=1 Tax=Actinoplanes sp. L3-i22 TaxID=2836373 RepID=UPI001C847FBF|nr:histidine kinase [Actinoplanes sp. L3-i22]
MLRRLLTDAALALALMLLTVGPGLASGMLVTPKPEVVQSYLERSGIPVDLPWWLFATLILGGLLLRQHRPAVALGLVGAGTLGHLFIQTKWQLLDLALPLVVYTVAATARHRRRSIAVLVVTMALVYAATLTSRINTQDDQKAAMTVKQEQQRIEQEVAVVQRTKATPDKVIPVSILVDTSQAVLEMWLLLVAAFAVGDGMRSRRAHLAAVEQRTADLAREERQRAALAVAAERTRITRELHDVVAHGMSVIVVQAQGAAAALDRHPERTATALRHVIETGRSSLAEMRRLIAAGRTEPAGDVELAPLPGVGAVPALVDQLRATGMRIDLRIEGVPDVIPAAVDLSAYRIVQEALTNTLKHAGAGASAQVRLEFSPSRLRVEVVDDGRGPSPPSAAAPSAAPPSAAPPSAAPPSAAPPSAAPHLAAPHLVALQPGAQVPSPSALGWSSAVPSGALSPSSAAPGWSSTPGSSSPSDSSSPPGWPSVSDLPSVAASFEAGHGNGLRGIAERVAMLGGVLEAGPGFPGGFRLGVTLPVGAAR